MCVYPLLSFENVLHFVTTLENKINKYTVRKSRNRKVHKIGEGKIACNYHDLTIWKVLTNINRQNGI